MIEKNGRKFVTLGELAEFLNDNVPAAETYRVPELRWNTPIPAVSPRSHRSPRY